jgi:hypothetical protein
MSRVPKRKSTREKYRAIQARYNHLYNVKRLRIDDCVAKIQEEYFISHPASVWQILRTTVPVEEEYDPDQLSLF